MIEDIRANIKREKEIIAEINKIYESMESIAGLNDESIGFYKESINSLKKQIKILNASLPVLVSQISIAKPLKAEQKRDASKEIITLSYVSPLTQEKKIVIINKEDKEKFAKELRVSEETIESLKKKEKTEEKIIIIKKQSKFARISNKLFLSTSEKLAPSLKDVKEDMKKANMQVLLQTYTSISLFSSLLIFLASLFVFIIVLIFNFSYITFIWIPFLMPFLGIAAFYLYPSTQKNSFDKKIAYELPFATIYMAAISGSNIEPSKIFKIIATSEDYPAISIEIKKLLNQVDIYGYDLVTALKNSARLTPNKKLAELLGGIATNIISGGSLKDYLEKKSENLLLDYKWERQKYNALAETFMDIYISLLITAPMILVMMVVILNVTNIQTGMPIDVLMTLAILGVVLVNIIFMVALSSKQPKI
jgi:pilus assembly protein TadC